MRTKGILLGKAYETCTRLPDGLRSGNSLRANTGIRSGQGNAGNQGGGSAEGTGIEETFINLAGGLGAKIVVVPTAAAIVRRTAACASTKRSALASWKKGATNVWMLHTHDPKVADTEEFAKVLRDANAVWFEVAGSGILSIPTPTPGPCVNSTRCWNGGVIGGSSAGASVQGDYLVRGAIFYSDIVMTPEPEHEHGFAFLRKSAIDQHINTCNRWDDIIPVIKKYPNLLGIGLSEGTAIVVTGDRFQVIGKWKVAVHDNTRNYQPWEKPYYVLSPGDVYNMKTRAIEKLGTGVLAPPSLLPAKGAQ